MRLSPKTTCTAPAATMIAQVTGQPKVVMVPASTTVSPADGPLTCSAEPPNTVATTPPTTADIRPAIIGAPAASATAKESGTATRNTTIDAGTSCRRFSRAVSQRLSPGGPVVRASSAVLIMGVGNRTNPQKSAMQTILMFSCEKRNKEPWDQSDIKVIDHWGGTRPFASNDAPVDYGWCALVHGK
jgi:hypothetical protein